MFQDLRFHFFSIVSAIQSWFRGRYGFQIVGDLDLRPDVKMDVFKKVIEGVSHIDARMAKMLKNRLRDLEVDFKKNNLEDQNLIFEEGGYFSASNDTEPMAESAAMYLAMKKLKDQFPYHGAAIIKEYVIRFKHQPENAIHFLVVDSGPAHWTAFYDQLRFMIFFNKLPLLTRQLGWARWNPGLMEVWV